MKAAIYIIILTVLTLANLSYAQNTGQQWKRYTEQNSGLPGSYIVAIACEYINSKNVMWLSTSGGLTKYNGITWQVYDTNNSPMNGGPMSITIGNDGVKWFGTWGRGMYKYDEPNNIWTAYNKDNSHLPSNIVYSIAVDTLTNIKWLGMGSGITGGLVRLDDSNGDTNWTIYHVISKAGYYNSVHTIAIEYKQGKTILWLGTTGGLFKYTVEDNEWREYNSSNSGLPNNDIRKVSIDREGNKWLCFAFAYTAKFNDSTNQWIKYNYLNSGLPSSCGPEQIVSDRNNVKWMATTGGAGGFIKLEDTTWTVFNPTNSPLSSYDSYSIAIDSSGNKWIGNSGGLYVYNESGIVGVNNNSIELPSGFKLNQNYPNPFNPETVISYQLSAISDVRLSVYDITGKLISTIVNERQNAGVYNVRFNGSTLPSGIYLYRLSVGDYKETKKMMLVK